uniref:Secretogranin-3 n=1 Tax=Mesocestoides corti TaxID=53468 RepID=A0A5K3F9H5_MESCO
MATLVSAIILFVAALVTATPVIPPPGFTEVEQTTITGLLEKHKLSDIIKILLYVEERRFIKPPPRHHSEEIKPDGKEQMTTPRPIPEEEIEATPDEARKDDAVYPDRYRLNEFFDEEPWRHTRE